MAADPWSRPTLDDLKRILAGNVEPGCECEHDRAADRLDLSVPAEIRTARGNTIAARTREISRFGVGFLHRGAIQPGEVSVQMASDSCEYNYRVLIEWCKPCENGMFLSGGKFVGKAGSLG